MAAGLGFKTFNTGDVLTAADTNGYLMQGVWVFASSAARSAAVTSPQEGNVSFLKDTNSFEIYDGAAWVAYGSGDITGVTAGTGISGGGTSGDVTITNSMATTIDAKGDLIVGTGNDAFARLAVGATNGHVLTVDSSTATGLKYAAVTSNAGLVYINTLTLSSTGTGGATIDSVFTSTYENYRIVLYTTANSGATTNIGFQLRSGGTTTTANYKSQYGSLESTTWYNGADGLGTDEWYIGNNYSAQVNMVTVFDVAAPQLASRTFFVGMSSEYNTTTGAGLRVNSGMQSDSTQFDGFLIRPSTGTISGKAAIYGYAKA